MPIDLDRVSPLSQPAGPGLVLFVVVTAATVLCTQVGRAESPGSELRAQAPRLSRSALIERGIEFNFEGRLEEALAVWRELRARAPLDPAAPVLETSTWYWYENYEPKYPGLEDKILASSVEGIRKAEAKLASDDKDAEAHYYLGTALMNLARMYGSSGRFVKAGTVGERGRQHLERVLELDPQRVDARYGLGLASFYASLIANFVRWLSILWFIPTGDAELGLAHLQEVEEKGRLNKDDAALILMNINTHHRENYAYARELGTKLLTHYPDNTVLQFEMIELAIAARDCEGAVTAARALEARELVLPRDKGRAQVARVWRARAELAMGKPRIGMETLEAFGEREPANPSWGACWVALTRGSSRSSCLPQLHSGVTASPRAPCGSQRFRPPGWVIGPSLRATPLCLAALRR